MILPVVALFAVPTEPKPTAISGENVSTMEGHYDAVGVLLANGAFHTYSTDLKLPIEIANDEGYQDIASLLLSAGATTPVRISPPRTQGDTLVSTLIDGVILAASVYLIVEGIGYSGVSFEERCIARPSELNRLALPIDQIIGIRLDEPENEWDLVAQQLCQESGQSVLLDITSLPKRVGLFLLKRFISNENVRDILVCYTPAEAYREG